MTLLSRRVPMLDAVPGLTHGFEARLEHAGLETREASQARASEALRPLGCLYRMRQVHGTLVRHAPWDGRPEGDVAVTGSPGILIGVETADCLPLLLVDPIRKVAAAVHAGWRGTAAGAAAAAVAALETLGCRPRDLLAALGPCIGPCCYEVGEEVRARFSAADAGCFRPGARGRPHLDLRAANLHQLLAAGLDPDRLQHVADCTFCAAAENHSYRREGPQGGRMLAYVGFVQGAG